MAMTENHLRAPINETVLIESQVLTANTLVYAYISTLTGCSVTVKHGTQNIQNLWNFVFHCVMIFNWKI